MYLPVGPANSSADTVSLVYSLDNLKGLCQIGTILVNNININIFNPI